VYVTVSCARGWSCVRVFVKPPRATRVTFAYHHRRSLIRSLFLSLSFCSVFCRSFSSWLVFVVLTFPDFQVYLFFNILSFIYTTINHKRILPPICVFKKIHQSSAKSSGVRQLCALPVPWNGRVWRLVHWPTQRGVLFEHMELPAKLLNHFLRSNQSEINQNSEGNSQGLPKIVISNWQTNQVTKVICKY